MKVQKFNSTALAKILKQYPDVDTGRTWGDQSVIRSEIISARDSWLFDKKIDTTASTIRIYDDSDGDRLIVEIDSYKFRLDGDFVTKEERI